MQKDNITILHKLFITPGLSQHALYDLDNMSVFNLLYVDQFFYTQLLTQLCIFVCSDVKCANILMSRKFSFPVLSSLVFKSEQDASVCVKISLLQFGYERFPKLIHLKISGLYDCESIIIDERIHLNSFQCQSQSLLSIQMDTSQLSSLSLRDIERLFKENFEQARRLFTPDVLTHLTLDRCFLPREFYLNLLPTLGQLQEFDFIHPILPNLAHESSDTFRQFWSDCFIHVSSPYLMKLRMETSGPLHLNHSKQLESIEICDFFDSFSFTFLDQREQDYLLFPYLTNLEIQMDFQHLLPFLLSMNYNSLPSIQKISFSELPISLTSREESNCSFGYQITEEEKHRDCTVSLVKSIYPEWLQYTSSLCINTDYIAPPQIHLVDFSALVELQIASAKVVLSNLPNLVRLKILSSNDALRYLNIQNVPNLKELCFFSCGKDCCITQFPRRYNKNLLQPIVFNIDVNWKQMETLALPIVMNAIEEGITHPLSASNILKILGQTSHLQTLSLLWPSSLYLRPISSFPIGISELAPLLPKLRHLELFSLHRMREMFISNFVKLEVLRFVDCTEIPGLVIENMPILKSIQFQKKSEYCFLHENMELSIRSCSQLTSVLFGPTSLKNLFLLLSDNIPFTAKFDFSLSGIGSIIVNEQNIWRKCLTNSSFYHRFGPNV